MPAHKFATHNWGYIPGGPSGEHPATMAKLPEPRLKMRPLKRTVLPTAMAGGGVAPDTVAPGGGAVAAPV